MTQNESVCSYHFTNDKSLNAQLPLIIFIILINIVNKRIYFQRNSSYLQYQDNQTKFSFASDFEVKECVSQDYNRSEMLLIFLKEVQVIYAFLKEVKFIWLINSTYLPVIFCMIVGRSVKRPWCSRGRWGNAVRTGKADPSLFSQN